jgi:hypothetical protein
VVDFPNIYCALLVRSCFTKFMAIPNYTYLKLKIPSLKGVITVEGSFEQVYYYEQDYITQAVALVASYNPTALATMQEGHRRRKQVRQWRCLIDRASVRQIKF